MFRVCWCGAVPASLHCLQVVDVGPGLAIDGAGSTTFAARIHGEEGIRWKDTVQIDPSIVQHVGDGLEFLTGGEAIFANRAQSFGPWMNMFKKETGMPDMCV